MLGVTLYSPVVFIESLKNRRIQVKLNGKFGAFSFQKKRPEMFEMIARL
jgi:hypothetical protein